MLCNDSGDKVNIFITVVHRIQTPVDRSMRNDKDNGLPVKRMGAQLDDLLRRVGIDAPQQLVDGKIRKK